MYVVFIAGFTVGTLFGVVFHHWWVRPDFNKLKLDLERKEHQLKTISSFALRNANVKVVKSPKSNSGA